MRVALVALSLTAFATAGFAQKAEDISVETYDGVKLRGVFYSANAALQKNNACVIMLHAYTKDSKNPGWTDLAKKLADEQGYNVVTFDFRFHGAKSMDVVPDIFWKEPFNKSQVAGATKKPPKSEITFKDIKNGGKDYYPMLVNDVMAVRTYLDVLNDQGKVNTSTVYLVCAGDAATVAFLYMTAEWHREREVPNVGIPPVMVSANRRIFVGAQSCGRDMAGAVFLSPARHPSISTSTIEGYVSNAKYDSLLRTETPMLFINGEKDQKGKEGSRFFYDKVLVANPKSGSSLAKLPLTYHREIKDSKLADVELLGKGIETEKMITDFFTALDKDRKNKVAIPSRKYTKPLPVVFSSYGIGN